MWMWLEMADAHTGNGSGTGDHVDGDYDDEVNKMTVIPGSGGTHI